MLKTTWSDSEVEADSMSYIQHLITLTGMSSRRREFKRDPTQIIIIGEQAVKKNNNKTCSSFSSIIVWAFFHSRLLFLIPLSSSSSSFLRLFPEFLIKFYVDFLDSYFILFFPFRAHSAPFLMMIIFFSSTSTSLEEILFI